MEEGWLHTYISSTSKKALYHRVVFMQCRLSGILIHNKSYNQTRFIDKVAGERRHTFSQIVIARKFLILSYGEESGNAVNRQMTEGLENASKEAREVLT